VSWSCHFIINDYNSFYRIRIIMESIWPLFLLMEEKNPIKCEKLFIIKVFLDKIFDGS